MKKTIKFLAVILAVALCFSLVGCTTTVIETKSAYDIAVENGFEGTPTEWLASLKGDKGDKGDAGTSNDGKSAYEIAVDNGFEGSEEDWLASLKGQDGEDGEDGKDIYETWYSSLVAEGYDGSYSDFLNEYVKGGVVTETVPTETQVIQSALLSTVQIVIEVGNSYGSVGYYAGSGVIYDDDKENGVAYIITNFHVIYDANETDCLCKNVYVFLYGMQKIYEQDDTTTKQMLEACGIKATVLGGSHTDDIAVIKIESDVYKDGAYRPAKFGSGNDVIIGESAYVVGNPRGNGHSATSGVVSVTSEVIQLTGADGSTVISPRVMRVDAAINGGNSGGGIFNARGEVVAIVNAKTQTSTIDNMGYGIPTEVAVGIAKNVINRYYDTATYDDMVTANGFGYNKCVIGCVTSQTNLPAQYDEITGIVTVPTVITVTSITSGSVCDGIFEVGDVLKKATLNGEEIEIKYSYSLANLLLSAKPGDVLTVVLERDVDGTIQTLTKELVTQNTTYVL